MESIILIELPDIGGVKLIPINIKLFLQIRAYFVSKSVGRKVALLQSISTQHKYLSNIILILLE